MNFSPQVKAWILLVALVLGEGLTVGYGAYLSGSNPWAAAILGLGTAASSVYHRLSESPQDKSVTPPTPP